MRLMVVLAEVKKRWRLQNQDGLKVEFAAHDMPDTSIDFGSGIDGVDDQDHWFMRLICDGTLLLVRLPSLRSWLLRSLRTATRGRPLTMKDDGWDSDGVCNILVDTFTLSIPVIRAAQMVAGAIFDQRNRNDGNETDGGAEINEDLSACLSARFGSSHKHLLSSQLFSLPNCPPPVSSREGGAFQLLKGCHGRAYSVALVIALRLSHSQIQPHRLGANQNQAAAAATAVAKRGNGGGNEIRGYNKISEGPRYAVKPGMARPLKQCSLVSKADIRWTLRASIDNC